MRSIKFRAYLREPPYEHSDKDIESMVYWSLDECDARWPDHNGYEDWVVMQYTGLKDKNGKEIFEGDIVETHYEYNVSEYSTYDGSCEGMFRGVVSYRPSCGFFQKNVLRQEHDTDNIDSWLKHHDLERIVQSRCKVIGNIYEHKHLLEE